MVMADRNFDEMRNGRRSRGGSPNFSDDSSAAEDSDHDNGMRVGNDYQASIPVYNPDTKLENRAEAILVWAPSIELSDGKVDEYVHIAKEKHGYNTEQALGMLFWHKHNVDKALSDLANFTPFPDEWTVEDKVLFEQAFSFHGKSFHRIRQMLPDKSIAILVKYYYSWKKTRSRTSLMDRQAKKLAGNKEDSDGSDEGSGSPGSDGENNKENGVDRTKSSCSNCNIPTSQLHSTPKGSFCNSCYQYWRRTGVMRSSGSKRHEQQHGVRHAPYKHKRKPPRGMFLNQEDLQSIVTGPPGQGETILKSLDSELVSLKRQVQNNKQIISMQKHKTASALDDARPPEVMVRINPRWTNDELLLAVQGVRKYGKDFHAIADVIGNKTEAHVRSFFVIYRQRYNLDEVLAEYEAENGLEGPKDMDDDDDLKIIEEKMEVDKTPEESSPLPSSGAQPTVTPPPLLKQPQLSVGRSQPHSSLLPPKHTILQQPPPLIRPNPIPVPANGKSLTGLATSQSLTGKD